MAGADAAGHWDLSFVAARVLAMHIARTGVRARCGGRVARGIGGDDGAMAGLKGVRASRLARARTSA